MKLGKLKISRNKMKIEEIQARLNISYKLYQQYIWLLDSYVLDYFVDNHWSKLTENQQNFLEKLEPTDIAALLDYENNLNYRVWPLSILALKNILQHLCLPRQCSPENGTNDKLFFKNVKLKKRHEIMILSKICYQTALESDCFNIIDVGSGLGHLSRVLSYKYGFNVCAIEGQHDLNEQAKDLDHKFEQLFQKKCAKSFVKGTINRVHYRVPEHLNYNDFLRIIRNSFNNWDGNFQFGIIGLHSCGDLGTNLLKFYKNSKHVKFVNFIGCCYMKLTTTTQSEKDVSFPLSLHCLKNHFNMNYNSLEVACHAIENYVDKLRNGEIWKLKIHCYRATIEKILVDLSSKLKHSVLGNVKYTENLTFETYCNKALKKLQIELPTNINDGSMENYLKQWKNVVVIYSLRLLFAPLIETIILLDRQLFLQEIENSNVNLLPIFHSKISPRNQILIGIKH